MIIYGPEDARLQPVADQDIGPRGLAGPPALQGMRFVEKKITPENMATLLGALPGTQPT